MTDREIHERNDDTISKFFPAVHETLVIVSDESCATTRYGFTEEASTDCAFMTEAFRKLHRRSVRP